MNYIVNLLPPAVKSDITYARRNRTLLLWSIGGMCVLVLVSLTIFAGGQYIDSSRKKLQSELDSATSDVTTKKLDEIKSQASELSDGVKLLARILSSQVMFSKLLQEIGKLMPKDTILGDISLSSKINGPLELTAFAVNEIAAAQILVNLSDKNTSLFEKVDLLNHACNEATDGRYKCVVGMRALFKSDAAITFMPKQPEKTTTGSTP